MGTVTLVILLVLLLATVWGIAFAVRLARRNSARLTTDTEAVPGMPTGAPPEWASEHTPEAKMHRRLVALARAIGKLPLEDAPEIDRRAAVVRRLQELDSRLIAEGPDPSDEAVDALAPELKEIQAEAAGLTAKPPLR